MNRSAVLFASTSLLIAGALALPPRSGQCGGMPKPAGRHPPRPAANPGTAAFRPRRRALPSADLPPPTRQQDVSPLGRRSRCRVATRPFKGVTIGCCPGCEGKWDRRLTTRRWLCSPRTRFRGGDGDHDAAVKPAAQRTSSPSSPTRRGAAATPDGEGRPRLPRSVRARRTAALVPCSWTRGRATVSENAGDGRGRGGTYRDHHLLPELKEMPGFVMTVTKEGCADVRHDLDRAAIGSFTVPRPTTMPNVTSHHLRGGG